MRGTRSISPEANARLTGGLAAMLLVLLAAESVTVLSVGSLLTAHVVIGLVLVPPVLAKVASAFWRFARYYLEEPEYQAKGAPMLLLRVLGPAVVILTVVLFGSGMALLVVPAPWHGRILLLHKVSFILWLAVMAVHVLGHLLDTLHLAPLDWLAASSRRVRGAGTRRLGLVATLLVGAVLAYSMVGYVGSYRAQVDHLEHAGVTTRIGRHE